MFVYSELETYVYSEGLGVISILFEGELDLVEQTSHLLYQPITISNRKLTIVKATHENSVDSRKSLLKVLSFLENTSSRFVLLEHTALIDSIDKRPPRRTTNGNLYFPVGAITPYFDPPSQEGVYGNDKRGIDFRKSVGAEDPVTATNLYYSEFVDKNNLEGLTDLVQCGLKHYSMIVHDSEGKLNISFLQNQNMNTARYFFDPEAVFCSNEIVLRVLRGVRYSLQDIKIKNSLRKMTIEV
jgi:hypothetical protein